MCFGKPKTNDYDDGKPFSAPGGRQGQPVQPPRNPGKASNGATPSGEGAYLVFRPSEKSGTLTRMWCKTKPEGILVAFFQAGKPIADFKFKRDFDEDLKSQATEVRNFRFGCSMFFKEALSDVVMSPRIFIYPYQEQRYEFRLATLREGGLVETWGEGWSDVYPSKSRTPVVKIQYAAAFYGKQKDFDGKPNMPVSLFSSLMSSKQETCVKCV